MKSPSDHEPMLPWGQTSTDGGNGDERSAVVGNERLTTLAGAVLLVLIVVELVSVPTLRAAVRPRLDRGAPGRPARRQARLDRLPLPALLHRIARLRAQRSAPPAAAGSRPAAPRQASQVEVDGR